MPNALTTFFSFSPLRVRRTISCSTCSWEEMPRSIQAAAVLSR